MTSHRNLRLLVTGASGQLGSYVLRALARTDHRIVAWSGSTRGSLFRTCLEPVDLTQAESVAAAFRAARPHVVMHIAALAQLSACFRDPQRALAVNVGATRQLLELADAAEARFVFVSTDLVFDGRHGPYRVGDRPYPTSVYGRTKLAAEQLVLAAPRGCVVRLSLLFGPALHGRPTFFDRQLAALQGGPSCTLFADEWRTPLSLETAAQALRAFVDTDAPGLWHVGGPERLSRWEMGQQLARLRPGRPAALIAAQRADVPADEPRPRDVSLDASSWRAAFPHLPWPAFEEALAELLDHA